MSLPLEKIFITLLASVVIVSAQGLSQEEIACENTLNSCIEKCDMDENSNESCSQKCDEAYDACVPPVNVDTEEMPEEES